NVVVSLKDGELQLRRGDWSGPLVYWNATNFRWSVPTSSPTGPMFIKFDVAPDNSVTGLYFGLAGDVSLLGRVREGGRGGRGGPPAYVYLWIPVDRGRPPAHLRHRLTFQRDSITTEVLEGTTIPVERAAVAISPPVRGEWAAFNGPSNASGHRRLVLALDGHV